MLVATKNKSIETIQVNLGSVNYFSNASAWLGDEGKVMLTINHKYAIPQGYHVKDLKIKDGTVISSRNYKLAYEYVMKAAKAKKSLTKPQINMIKSHVSGIKLVVAFPNGDEADAKISLHNTFSDWIGDWQRVKADMEELEDDSFLWTQLLKLLGGDPTALRGVGTLLNTQLSKY